MSIVEADTLIRGYKASWLAIDCTYLFQSTSQRISLCACSECDLRWYAGAPSGDATFYENLQRYPFYYQSAKAEYPFAKDRIGRGDRVLEVGCGRGAFARYLPNGATYRGLEFNQTAIDAARALGLDVEMRTIESEATARQCFYDRVCHFQVLEHVLDPKGFMANCVKALKPGGKLLFAVPSEDSFLGRAESTWLNMPPHHLTRWTDSALANIVRAVGLTPIETWHEPVADYDRQWHRSVVMATGWKSLLCAKPALIARPGMTRAISAAARVPGLGSILYRRGIAAFPEITRGHTVCVVAVKG